MLQNSKIHPTIPVSNMARARDFYENKLGLKGQESQSGIMYNCGGGTLFLLFESAGAGQSSSTWAGWETDDITREVSDLKAKGVTFEEYDYPTLKTVDSIADMGDGKAAWFKDSEGNTLGLIQRTV